jgi:hypothetical protein
MQVTMQRDHEGGTLEQRRRQAEIAWNRFTGVGSAVSDEGCCIGDCIEESWRRSARHVSPSIAQAPLIDKGNVAERWSDSPLQLAASDAVLREIASVSNEAGLVAALSDPHGCLLWTHAATPMQEAANRVNFAPGGCWSESATGTNAVGVALALQQPATVFSAEHFAACMHDWVCYAAPIIHPASGELIGVLDLSTEWSRHTPLGQNAVNDFARTIARNLPERPQRAELEIQALGIPRVLFRGLEIHVSRRQLEILCLLILNPRGLSLGAFHAALYGDAPISMSTLKSELSQLRTLLDGRIGSRPYRLQLSTWADFVTLWRVLKDKKAEKALKLYKGPFLPHSSSPELEEWRDCIDAVMNRVVSSCEDTEMLVDSLSEQVQGSELVRGRLKELTGK